METHTQPRSVHQTAYGGSTQHQSRAKQRQITPRTDPHSNGFGFDRYAIIFDTHMRMRICRIFADFSSSSVCAYICHWQLHEVSIRWIFICIIPSYYDMYAKWLVKFSRLRFPCRMRMIFGTYKFGSWSWNIKNVMVRFVLSINLVILLDVLEVTIWNNYQFWHHVLVWDDSIGTWIYGGTAKGVWRCL
jgi:hypothetical protein